MSKLLTSYKVQYFIITIENILYFDKNSSMNYHHELKYIIFSLWTLKG